MAHERRRAALAALCVLAVAVAATLFPAGGFGSQPAGVGVGGGDGDGAPSGSAGGPDSVSTSTADRPTTTASAGTTASADPDSSDDGGPTDPTTTTTETTTAVGDADLGGPGDLLASVAMTALGVVGLLGAVGLWTGALAVADAGGAIPFTVVVWGTPVGELVGRVPTRTMAVVVALASSVPRLLDDAASLTRAFGGGLASVLGAAGRASADAVRIAGTGLAATVAAVPRALAGLGAGAGLFASLGSVGVPSLGRSRGSDDGGRSRSGTRPDDSSEETGPPSVEEAWQAMRDRVPVSNRRTRTPGEVARTAVRRGYPDEAVRRLTDAFREVRYGDLPRDDRTDSARSALDRLRDYWGDDE